MTTAPHQQFASITAPADDELQLLDAYRRWAFGRSNSKG